MSVIKICFIINKIIIFMRTIPIFIGYDSRERAATNVLIDSLYQRSSIPLSIIPLVTSQLENKEIYWREKDPKQSTEFSFTRFLVPYLMNYEGWSIFMDCDMLATCDIKELWEQRNDKYSLMCVKHEHIPTEKIKFQGEVQSVYPKKNWSSLMLFNNKQCKALTPDYVNNASGLDLHRFNWLENENKIGEINNEWNYLLEVHNSDLNQNIQGKKLVHWTLGGPWFKDQRKAGGIFALDWFIARDNAMKLWD